MFDQKRRLGDERRDAQIRNNVHKDETSVDGFSGAPNICMDQIQERSTLGKSRVELLITAAPWIPTIRRILDPPVSACSVFGAGLGQGPAGLMCL